MSAFAEWCECAVHERPTLYYAMTTFLGITVLVFGFMHLPDSPMLKAIGITAVQKRVSATGNGVYWSMRASFNQTGMEEHTQVFGNVEAVGPTGKLVVSVPERNKWVKRDLALANAEIIDMGGAARIVGTYRTESARFDIYGADRVVVWIRNAPLNVKLIEAGVAKPDSNPLTNIFDLAFATYYWGIAFPQTNGPGIDATSDLRAH